MKLTNVLLVAGGVGFLFKDQIASYLGIGTAPADTSNTGSNTDTTNTNTNTGTQPTGAQATTRDLMLAYLASHSMPSLMNADQWGWVYQQVRGTAAPDPLSVWPNEDRQRMRTFDEWFTGMSAAGLSGVPTRRRARGVRAYTSAAWES